MFFSRRILYTSGIKFYCMSFAEYHPYCPILRATVHKNQTKSEICGKVKIFEFAFILDLG